MDRPVVVEEVYLTDWTNPAVSGWVNKNFTDHDRDVAYTVLIWVGDNFPGTKEKLGISSQKVS